MSQRKLVVETYQNDPAKCKYAKRGFPWRARLVDARTGETVFESPMASMTRDNADRYGQRYKKRYEQTGAFDRGEPGVR